MTERMDHALARGTERVAGWADLLDRINVFPVADGDTGRNLVITLSPLIRGARTSEDLVERLLLAARGNSGNIAARFLSGLLKANSPEELREAAALGRDLAWRAVPNPRAGTMLSLFDGLCAALEALAPVTEGVDFFEALVARLQDTVMETAETLPILKEAGVVDSGALGMFLFLEGYFRALAGSEEGYTEIMDAFGDRVRLDSHEDVGRVTEDGCCIDVVLETGGAGGDLQEQLSGIGGSVVAMQHGDRVKVHLHAQDVDEARARIGALGEILSFSSDDLQAQQQEFRKVRPEPALHVFTDAAGSVNREDAERLGFTLLDSYINMGTRSVPETRLDPAELYAAMRAGVPVSTSQASTFERRQHYEKLLSVHGRALYLCVGSVYTGNYQAVMDWKESRDTEDRLTVIDTGAASGRLGIAALTLAERSLSASDPAELLHGARQVVDESREYIFLEQLTYLARGGRLSKTKAFFGDILRKKPVVTPRASGVEKVAVVRDWKEQEDLAIAKLEEETPASGPLSVLLCYTDNKDRVREIARKVTAVRPESRIRLQPLSLTSGAHMGPGTWSIAFLAGHAFGGEAG